MGYLKQPRARRALLLGLASASLFAGFPAIDLHVARWFHRDGTFPLARSGWVRLLHESVAYVIVAVLVTTFCLFLFNRVRKADVCGIDAKVVCYLLSVLILGAGLTVNMIFKSGFGRARPRNVEEFGGCQRFTPAFTLATECADNCSFSSGDTAGACFTFALALVLRRRDAMLAAITFGCLVSLSRIVSGAHFLSDTIVSILVMWLAADSLYFYMLLPGRQATLAPATGTYGSPAIADEAGTGCGGETSRTASNPRGIGIAAR